MSRNSRHALLFTIALFAVVLVGIFPADAGKGGKKGKPGGGDPTPPPVQYQLKIFEMPADSDGSNYAMAMNNFGEVVGSYLDADGRNHAYLYAPSLNPTTVLDLNALTFHPEYGIPDGWYLAKARGINDHGDIVGNMEKIGENYGDVRRGFVIQRSGEENPKLILLPDGAWLNSFAHAINELGDVLGRFQTTEGEGYRFSYLFKPGLYGEADLEPHVLPLATGFFPSLNTLGQVAGMGLDGPAFRYTRGEPLERFPEIDYLVSSRNGVGDINDAGEFCGSILYKPGGKGKTVRDAFRYGAELEPIPNTTAAQAINVAGDFIERDPVMYHEGTGLITLDDNVVVGDPFDVLLWLNASATYLRDITERGSLNELSPTFPGICGYMTVLDVGYSSFLLTPVPVP